MIGYTDEYPETDWTIERTSGEHHIEFDIYESKQISADVDPVTFSKAVEEFAESYTPLYKSDVEHLIASTKKRLPKNAVSKLVILSYNTYSSYDEGPIPRIQCDIWFYVPKTIAQKKNFLKQQEALKKKQLSSEARKEALAKEKEKQERKLFEKLKKKYG